MRKISGYTFLVLCATLAIDVRAEDNCKHFDYSLEQIAQFRLNQFPTDMFEQWQGKTIRTIRIESEPVFDPNNPSENNFLYRALDKLHLNTRPRVIKAQLLFAEGQPLESEKILESARILRGRGYLANAYIVPEQVCGDSIDLRVVTRDAWSTEPDTSLSHDGGETKSGFGICENNLLGSGTTLSVGYEKMAERNTVSYELTSPHVLNTRYKAHLLYADKSDGTDKVFDISKPFYSLQTRWAYGFSTKDITETEHIRAGDKDLDEFSHEVVNREISLGYAFLVSDAATHRLSTGFTHSEDVFRRTPKTVQPLPEERENTYPWIGYRYLQNEFGVFKNIRQIQRLEDISTGKDFYVRLGYGGDSFDNDRDALFISSKYSDYQGIFDKHLLEFSGGLDARVQTESEAPDSGVAYAEFSYNYFISEKQRWYLAARFDRGENLRSYEELTVGGSTGMRGYPLDYQRGNKRYLLTLERRYFSDVHLFNLLRFGMVAFAESGRAWGSSYDRFYSNDQNLTDIGLGLRISSSKAKIGNVVHIDLSMPTASKQDIDKFQWLVTTSTLF